MDLKNRRLQLALFTANKVMFERFLVFAGQIDCDTHMARLADVPPQLGGGFVQDNVRRMLHNYQLPFAIIAVTGTAEEIQHAAKVFVETRRKVPTMLAMCPTGFRYMNTTFDVPFSAMDGPGSHKIVGSLLIGVESEFEGYEPARFGEPTFCGPLETWHKEGLAYLAEYVRRVAKPALRSVTC